MRLRCRKFGADGTPWVLDQCRRRRGHLGKHRSEWRTEWDAQDEANWIAIRAQDQRDQWRKIEEMVERGEMTWDQVNDRIRDFFGTLSEVFAKTVL